MRKNSFRMATWVFLIAVTLPGAAERARAQTAQAAYPAMAPLDQYLMADKDAEIALARSGAPPSVASGAEVMVLGRDGYTTAVKGTNGFLCVVERGWAVQTTNPQFWNPNIRSPLCFNEAAAKTFATIYLMKTRLVLEGKTREEVLAAMNAAFASGELPALAPGAECYMLSKQQYINDAVKNWYPHVMFYVPGDTTAKSWGANMDGSPMIAGADPQERVTVMMVRVTQWSDGTPGPPIKY
jgi:hypothetical protein